MLGMLTLNIACLHLTLNVRNFDLEHCMLTFDLECQECWPWISCACFWPWTTCACFWPWIICMLTFYFGILIWFSCDCMIRGDLEFHLWPLTLNDLAVIILGLILRWYFPYSITVYVASNNRWFQLKLEVFHYLLDTTMLLEIERTCLWDSHSKIIVNGDNNISL